jgi:hypothetical protein
MYHSHITKKWLVSTAAAATIFSTLWGCDGKRGSTSVEFVIAPVSSLQDSRAYVPELASHQN